MPCCKCGRNLMNTMSPLHVGLIIVCLTAIANAAFLLSSLDPDTSSSEIYLQNTVDPTVRHVKFPEKYEDKNTFDKVTFNYPYDSERIQRVYFSTRPRLEVFDDGVIKNEPRVVDKNNEQIVTVLSSVERSFYDYTSSSSLDLSPQSENSTEMTISDERHGEITVRNISNYLRSIPKRYQRADERHTNNEHYGSRRSKNLRYKSSFPSAKHLQVPEELENQQLQGHTIKGIQFDTTTRPLENIQTTAIPEYSSEDSGKNTLIEQTTEIAATANTSNGNGDIFDSFSPTQSQSPDLEVTTDILRPPGRYDFRYNCNNECDSHETTESGTLQSSNVSPTSERKQEWAVKFFPKPESNVTVKNQISVTSSTEAENNDFVNSTVTVSTRENESAAEELNTQSSVKLQKQEVNFFLRNSSSNGSETNSTSLKTEFMSVVEHTSNDRNLSQTPVDIHERRGKMSDSVGASNQPDEPKKGYSKGYFDLDYGELRTLYLNMGHSIPEFQPGALLPFLEPFRRLPVAEEKVWKENDDAKEAPKRSGFGVRTKPAATTHVPTIESTFYPYRLEDTSLHFSLKTPINTTPLSPTTRTNTRRLDFQSNHETNAENEDDDDDEYIDIHESALTMETLAYFLIGTCCGLSILCLCIVVIALKCRRSLVHRRIRKQFRRRLCYAHSNNKPMTSMWQQQILNHLVQQQDHKRNNSFSSSNTCNCHCVTWSLGARNLDTQPICPTRNSVYLCGRKKLPFGAASTLQYESMLGRRRQTSSPHSREPPPKPDSSNENDSLDGESGTEPTSMCPKQCTCIRPPWMLPRPQSTYSACSAGRASSMKNCMRGPSHIGIEMCRFNRDCPPPVSGMNYLDRADGVVYWSSNEERLI